MSDDDGTDDHDKNCGKSKDENAEEASNDKHLERSPSVRKKLRALAFGHHKKSVPPKDASKKKKSLWTTKLNSRHKHNVASDASEPSVSCSSCICTGYKKTEEALPSKEDHMPRRKLSDVGNIVTLDNFQNVVSTVSIPSPQASTSSESNPFSVDDWDELARQERAKEIEEGIDPPPGFQSHIPSQGSNLPIQLSELTIALNQQLTLSIVAHPYLARLREAAGFSQEFFKLWERHLQGFQPHPTAHSQIDYVHCLVPDLLNISNCSFYWGKMDRYEAEKLLDKKPEGTFLLRDSAQEEYLFSVSFRRYGRTLHARIEQWNHKFSFDSHDPGVFASTTVCGLIEHYKDPSCCMFFEPMLTLPLNRSFVFPLQHLCRAVICSCIMYDGVNSLTLPKRLKFYLKEYHYKQRVRVRRFDYEQ